MITSIDALLQVLKESQAGHWKLFRDYNRSDPSPIAASITMVGADPELDLSLAALRRVIDALGPGKYHVRYNTVDTFNRGYFSTDFMVGSNTASLTQASQGIAGINALGYVTPDQLADKLELQRKDYEILQLQHQINAIKEDKENGGMIGSIMKVLNGNPELSKAVAQVISGVAGKVMPHPQIHTRTAHVGTVGYDTEKKDHPGSSGPDDQFPDHIKNLSDDEFENVQITMQDACLSLYAIDPEFPELLPKLFAMAQKEPQKYAMAKTFLK